MKSILDYAGNKIDLITDDYQDLSAYVVLSGGQDSTIALHWAIANFKRVGAITFSYGQRHESEILAARYIAGEAKIADHKVLNLGDAMPKGNALAGRTSIVEREGDLPTTFVPGRNLVMLSSAAGYAKEGGYDHLVAGMSQVDFSGYPDCRREVIDDIEAAIGRGVYENETFRIHTPLIFRSKPDSILMALGLGDACMKGLALSHTCYNGVFPPCGNCPACRIRTEAFKAVEIVDPIYTDLNPRWVEYLERTGGNA